MKRNKVYVDPACNINYTSFYIKGLWDVFGKRNVKFTSKYFKDLTYSLDSHCLAFVVNKKKYVIDCADSNKLYFPKFLKWADVYAKVNYNKDYLPKEYTSKIIKCQPNFGIGVFGNNKYEASIICLRNYLKSYKRLEYGFWGYLPPYLWLYKRAGISFGEAKSTVGSKFIFFVSRYWKGQDSVNQARINYIRACKRLDKEGLIEFKGGLVPDSKENDCPKDLILENEMPMKEYQSNMEKSLLVFNTPAYHLCHGWKLPEYLSQGKIILSTPFVNELAHPMTNSENIFFTVNDEDSIYKSLKTIILDKDIQKRLEEGSKLYWNKYSSPIRAVSMILKNTF